ncbi:MAG: hypothetical protein MJ225_01385 [Bacilli bacterium]|nr:hypothetical protein [Bacilli bacterium]
MNKKLLTLVLFAAMPLVACGNDNPGTQGGGGGGGGGGGDADIKVTFNMSQLLVDQEDLSSKTIEQSGVQIKFAKGTGTSAPKYYAESDQVPYSAARLYASNTMTFTASTTMKEVKITCGLWDNKDGSFTASTGTIQANADKSVETWTGSNETFTLTVAEKQRRVVTVEVTLGKGQGGGGGGGGGGETVTLQSVANKLKSLWSKYSPDLDHDTDEYGEFYNVYFFVEGDYRETEASTQTLLSLGTSLLTDEFELVYEAEWDSDWLMLDAYYMVGEEIIVEIQAYADTESGGGWVDSWIY